MARSVPRFHVRLDLSLLRQGLSVGLDFGLHSLTELARLGEFLEHSVYQVGSLAHQEGSIRFVLQNPPLRMGAFSSIRLFWNGVQVEPSRANVQPSGAERALPLAEIARDDPVVLPVGEATRFSFESENPGPGPHRVRLELTSLAIPPLVWMEFVDRLQTWSPERP